MKTEDFLFKTKQNSLNFKKIIDKCKNLLFNSTNANDTLKYAFKRELNKNILERYQFGYFPREYELNLFSNDEIKILCNLNILYKKDNVYISSFPNHQLVFPLIDDYNNFIGLIARTINDEECALHGYPKYKHNSFSKNYFLFGLNWAKDILFNRKSVFLVEGQLDCIMMQSNGFHNTVALGSTNFSFYHAFLLKKYGIEKINVIFDNDENGAGEKGRNKILKNNIEYGNLFIINNLYLPSHYKDIDLYLRKSNDTSLLLEAI